MNKGSTDGASGVLTDQIIGRLGWYLYGVTTCDPERAGFPGGVGLGGTSVQAIPQGSIVAIVSQVPLDGLDAESIGKRLSDPNGAAGWLEEMVRTHERVVEAIQRERGILPARFGCVYATSGDLMAALQHSHDRLYAQLRRFEGCDEWGVKLYANLSIIERRVSVENSAVLEIQKDLAAASPGRAYFLRRKLSDMAAAAIEQTLAGLAQTGYDRLAEHAIAAQIGARPKAPADNSSEVELLRAAFLVRRAAFDGFAAETYRFTEEQEGLRCEYSGPWPAYTFAALSEEALT